MRRLGDGGGILNLRNEYPARSVRSAVRIAATLLILLLVGCDLEASQRAFQPGARARPYAPAEPRLRIARVGWSEVLSGPVEPSGEVLEGDDLDVPMGAEEGMVIPSACGACGCLNLDR